MKVSTQDSLLYEIGVMLYRALNGSTNHISFKTSREFKKANNGYDICENVDAILKCIDIDAKDWEEIKTGYIMEAANVPASHDPENQGRLEFLEMLFREFKKSRE